MLQRMTITSLLENKEETCLAALANPGNVIIFQGDIASLIIEPKDIERLTTRFKQESKNASDSPENSLYLLVLAANLLVYFEKTETGEEEYAKEKGTKADKFFTKLAEYYQKISEAADTLKELQLNQLMGCVYLEYKSFRSAINYYRIAMNSAYALFPNSITHEQLKKHAAQLTTAILFQANDIYRQRHYRYAKKWYEETVEAAKKALNHTQDDNQNELHTLLNRANCGLARSIHQLAQECANSKYEARPDKVIKLCLQAIQISIDVLKAPTCTDKEKTKCLKRILGCSWIMQTLLKERSILALLTLGQKQSIRDNVEFMKEYLQQHPNEPMRNGLKKIIHLAEEDVLFIPPKRAINMHQLWQPSSEDRENQSSSNHTSIVIDKTSKQTNQVK